jgi:hypothetical protein
MEPTRRIDSLIEEIANSKTRVRHLLSSSVPVLTLPIDI